MRQELDMDPVQDALAAPSGTRHKIGNALAHVRDQPGLYAVYGSRDSWIELGIDPGSDPEHECGATAVLSRSSVDLKPSYVRSGG
jgi:hypothetical protein